jgi:transposase
MWTKANRARYNRDQLRDPSDVTEEEWGHLVALIPPARRGGCKRTVTIREVLNGLLYVLSTGCQWRAIPTDLPPRSTIFDYLERWQADGTLRQIHDALYVRCREQAERETSPSAGIIDSQSVKSAEKGGLPLTPRALMRANGSKGRSATC